MSGGRIQLSSDTFPWIPGEPDDGGGVNEVGVEQAALLMDGGLADVVAWAAYPVLCQYHGPLNLTGFDHGCGSFLLHIVPAKGGGEKGAVAPLIF